MNPNATSPHSAPAAARKARFSFSPLLSWASLILGMAACNASSNKPELIVKMRPLGVSSSPVIAAPGDKVHLTFHFALPAAETLETTVYEESDTTGASVPAPGVTLTNEQSVVDSVCPGHALRCTFASFDYAVLTAAFTVPDAAQLPMISGPSRRLRYSIHVSSASNATSVMGDLFVFAPGSPQLSGTPAAADIVEPAASAVSGAGDIPIQASITKYFEETATIGWFTGCGTIENRRAVATAWHTPESGSCTLVFTARGQDSRALAIRIKDYTVQ